MTNLLRGFGPGVSFVVLILFAFCIFGGGKEKMMNCKIDQNSGPSPWDFPRPSNLLGMFGMLLVPDFRLKCTYVTMKKDLAARERWAMTGGEPASTVQKLKNRGNETGSFHAENIL